MTYTRREWLSLTGVAAGGALLHGCRLGTTTLADPLAPRFTARPKAVAMPAHSGRIAIAHPDVDAVLYMPPSALERESVPVLVFLHGALRTVDFFVDAFMPAADEHAVAVLAPYADFGTWDAIHGYFGPDIVGINAALDWVFARWPVDPARIVLSGFSDGASYTLGVGRSNGDLFSRLVAFSPGFVVSAQPVGLPPILVTHGYDDTVLPYGNTSEILVPSLRSAGYDVDFRPFAGPHAVPLSIATEVMTQLGMSA
jgi:predicted esterase